MALRDSSYGYRNMERVRNPSMMGLGDIVVDANTAVANLGFSPYGPLSDSSQVPGGLTVVDSATLAQQQQMTQVTGCQSAYMIQGGPVAMAPNASTVQAIAPIAYPVTINPSVASPPTMCPVPSPAPLPALGGPTVYNSLVGLTLTDQQILDVYTNVKQGVSIADIAVSFNITQQQVEDIYTALLNGATTQQILNPAASQFDAVATLPTRALSSTPMDMNSLLPMFSMAAPMANIPTGLPSNASQVAVGVSPVASGTINLPVIGPVPTPVAVGGGLWLLFKLFAA